MKRLRHEIVMVELSRTNHLRNLKSLPKLAQVRFLTYFLTNLITRRLPINKKETIYAGQCFFFPTNFVFFLEFFFS